MDLGSLNIIGRAQRWKAYVASSLESLRAENAALQGALEQLRHELTLPGERDAILASLQALLEKHNVNAAVAEARLVGLEDELRRSTVLAAHQDDQRAELSVQLDNALVRIKDELAAAGAAIEGERGARERFDVDLDEILNGVLSEQAATKAALEIEHTVLEQLDASLGVLANAQAATNAALDQERAAREALAVSLNEIASGQTATNAALDQERAAREELAASLTEAASGHTATNTALDQERAAREALAVSLTEIVNDQAAVKAALETERSAREQLDAGVAAVTNAQAAAGATLDEERAARELLSASLTEIQRLQSELQGNLAEHAARLETLSSAPAAGFDELRTALSSALTEERAAYESAQASELAAIRTTLTEFTTENGALKNAIEAGQAERAADQAALAEMRALVESLGANLQNQVEAARAASAEAERVQQEAALQQQTLAASHAALLQRHDHLVSEAAGVFRAMAQTAGPAGRLLASAVGAYLTERSGSAMIVASQAPRNELVLGSGDIPALIGKIADGSLSRILVTADPPADGRPALDAGDELIPLFCEMPMLAHAFFARAPQPEPGMDEQQFYQNALTRLRTNPHVIDSVAQAYAQLFGSKPPPFDNLEAAPRTVPAEPKRRSALFLHNNYYHFNVLSNALRKRGWDTLTVSIESPTSPQRQFYHGEDLNLFDPDFDVMREKVRAFLATVPERFGALHFYGEGQASFFPAHYETAALPRKAPWDFFELRRHRTIIGYMPTGCLDGARQSDIRRITGGLCSKCIWETHPSVCNDARSAAWAQRLDAVCDWVGLEGDWVVGARTGGKYVRGPVVTTLDPKLWIPSLRLRKDMVLPREPNEILIYHGVGNYDVRRRAARDIKGTGAVFDAINSLKQEGLPVRLMFLSKVSSKEMRYQQVQADIVIDQLNYGRYGANARECMMLGLPVIGAVNAIQEGTAEPLRSLAECPIVRATTENVKDVLRQLVVDPAERQRVGRASREFALRWHGADACAERYERVIDRIRAGMPPDAPELYPARSVSSTKLALVGGGS